MRNATEPPVVVVDEQADLIHVGRGQGRAMTLADLVARVVDKAPPLTAHQLASIAALLRRPVDLRGEHR